MGLNGLDPYDILGVPQGSSRSVVRNAYKMMIIKTHPDKMNGDASYFMLVHKAYTEIEKMYKVTLSDAPKEKPKYKNEVNVTEPVKHNFSKNDTTFSNDKFNAFFKEHRIDDMDPFKRGYEKYMSERLQHQEEIDTLKTKQITRKKKQMVVYKEPEPMNELYTQSYGLLGNERVNDYSCNIGTDYMKAYSDPDELKDTTKKYKNLEQLVNERSVQSFEMTEDEVRSRKEKEKKLRKLEQYRISAYEKAKRDITERYIKLNNRIEN